ncbi:MAG: PA14 domain-containing protein, partial [Thermoguttaceae bacterium]
AIDADNGNLLWQDSFLVSTSNVSVTAVPSTDVSSGDISPEIGITGTPAIDAGTGYLFLVAKTMAVYNGNTADPHFVNTLYKVDIQNGTYTGAVIADTTAFGWNGSSFTSYTYNSGPYVLGDGDGYITVSGQNEVPFNSLRQMFRPAVALVNGQVILGSASHGDNGPYHGWMLTYSESNLALTGVLNTTPNGGLGGLWSGGDPIVTDGQGDFYFMTGNGTFNQSASNFPNPSALSSSDLNPGLPIDGDYGDSFVKVQVDTVHDSPTSQNVNGWGLKVVDYFTPYNQSSLSGADEDLGSGGPTLLPDAVGNAAHPYLLVGGGKEGSVYLVDRGTDNSTMTMGEFHNSTDDVVQELGANTVVGILSTPAYFNGQIYITSGYNNPFDSSENVPYPIFAFSISNALLTPDGATQDYFGNLDGSPTISANGTANGILWALERGTGELRAYAANPNDPSNDTLTDKIYNSSTVAADAPGSIMKFTVPMVANGDVYVGTGDSLVMYGLKAPPTTPPAAPSNLTITNASGSEVSLAWTNNATNASAYTDYVERSTDGVDFTQIGTASVDQTTYVDASVQPFTTYYYRVRAGNIIGYSAYTNVVTVETLGQPAVGGGDGLLGKYYANNNSFETSPTPPTSPPTLTRVDPEVDFNWNYTGPSPAVGQTDFEVEWTGEVQAQYSEDYTFYVLNDDGAALFVNRQEVISDLKPQSPAQESSSPIALQAGKSYAIEILYFQVGGGAEMELSWSSPHTPQEIIPQSQLFSGSAPAAPSNLQVAAISGTQTELATRMATRSIAC